MTQPTYDDEPDFVLLPDGTRVPSKVNHLRRIEALLHDLPDADSLPNLVTSPLTELLQKRTSCLIFIRAGEGGQRALYAHLKHSLIATGEEDVDSLGRDWVLAPNLGEMMAVLNGADPGEECTYTESRLLSCSLLITAVLPVPSGLPRQNILAGLFVGRAMSRRTTFVVVENESNMRGCLIPDGELATWISALPKVDLTRSKIAIGEVSAPLQSKGIIQQKATPIPSAPLPVAQSIYPPIYNYGPKQGK